MDQFRGQDGLGMKGLTSRAHLVHAAAPAPFLGVELFWFCPYTELLKHPGPGAPALPVGGALSGQGLTQGFSSVAQGKAGGFFCRPSLGGGPSRALAPVTPSCNDSPATPVHVVGSGRSQEPHSWQVE